MALAQRFGERWVERAYPVAELPQLLPVLAGETDVYLSTQRFWHWRRITRLAECGALAVDVDYHRVPELAGAHPLGVLEDAIGALQRARLPAPSLAIGSGRGVHLLWIHSPIPRAALPRWNACQHVLWQALRSLGADRGALDAARVLRVVGSRHGSAGVTVEALAALGEVWNFEDLAREVLPVGREELRDLRVQRALRRSQDALWTPPRRFTQATLGEARLTDLQALRALRWFGEPIPDFRDRWLFLAGTAMSWVAVPQVLRRELYALAHEIGGWTEGKARSKLSSVMSRAHAAARGERVEFAGEKMDPRYRFRNQTIIELLEITPEEERQLKTIISDDERRRRDRERKGSEMSRQEYEGRAEDRRAEASRMATEGLSNAAIAKALGITARRVRQLLQEANPQGRV